MSGFTICDIDWTKAAPERLIDGASTAGLVGCGRILDCGGTTVMPTPVPDADGIVRAIRTLPSGVADMRRLVSSPTDVAVDGTEELPSIVIPPMLVNVLLCIKLPAEREFGCEVTSSAPSKLRPLVRATASEKLLPRKALL